MSLFSKTVAERTKPGQRQDVEEQSYTFHAYGRSEGVAGIIISDQEYPALVAHQLLSKIVDEFLSRYPKTAFQNSNQELPFPQLKEYIVKYQDPHAADSIMKIQKELDETKIVLHKTIESVLERGSWTPQDQWDARKTTRMLTNLHNRREDRLAGCKIRWPKCAEQDVLYPGEEAELLLHSHVKTLRLEMAIHTHGVWVFRWISECSSDSLQHCQTQLALPCFAPSTNPFVEIR